METLSERRCAPCHGGTPRLTEDEIAELLPQLRGWTVTDGVRLTKDYSFSNFADALAFVNRVGRVAEEEDHHPDISFGWGRARLDIETHAIGGLSINDFILAAKVDALGEETEHNGVAADQI